MRRRDSATDAAGEIRLRHSSVTSSPDACRVTVLAGGLRDRERQPRVPAGRRLAASNSPYPFRPECLIIPDRKNISNLRADAENARTEAAENAGWPKSS